jgi:hypothetical protein
VEKLHENDKLPVENNQIHVLDHDHRSGDIRGNGQIIMEDVTENGHGNKSKPVGHTDLHLHTGTAEIQMEIPESKGGPQILSNVIAYANGQ